MSPPRIELTSAKSLRPSDRLQGVVRWDLSEAPVRAELRLLWFTRGEGKPDREVIRVEPVEQLPRAQEGSPYRGTAARPQQRSELRPSERRSFSFRMPEGPYSFCGSLITLVWALELEVEPDGLADQVEVSLSASGEAIHP